MAYMYGRIARSAASFYTYSSRLYRVQALNKYFLKILIYDRSL